jgi:hypothetical protein
MQQIEIISPSGRRLKASAKAFELIYKTAGYVRADEAKANTVSTQPRESPKKAAPQKRSKK